MIKMPLFKELRQVKEKLGHTDVMVSIRPLSETITSESQT